MKDYSEQNASMFKGQINERSLNERFNLNSKGEFDDAVEHELGVRVNDFKLMEITKRMLRYH